jgi:hypothetical protein
MAFIIKKMFVRSSCQTSLYEMQTKKKDDSPLFHKIYVQKSVLKITLYTHMWTVMQQRVQIFRIDDKHHGEIEPYP